MKNFLFSLVILFACAAAHAENDHVRIAQENAPAVVAINVVKKDGSTFTGTGFVLRQDGLIATNRHVAEDALYINITFSNGAVSGEAVPVATAANVDLALLKIQALNLPTVFLADSDSVLPGQPITVIGNPRRLQNTISAGLISQVRKKSDGIIWHQISAPISPSSSGSPVFDAEGKVISIAFASYKGDDNQNLNFAVPSNYLAQLTAVAGYPLSSNDPSTPQAAQPKTANPVLNHFKKSWSVLKRLLHIGEK